MTSALSEVPVGAPNLHQILEGCLGDRGLLQAWPRLGGLRGECQVTSPDGDVLAEAALPVDLGVLHILHPPLSPLGKSFAPAYAHKKSCPWDPSRLPQLVIQNKKCTPQPYSFRTRNV